ncbi:ATP-dependent DNA ligase [Streptomyces sp. NPDC048111]|uniref:ATP-dependent DNA ligase n=1 Tax=Streptomyces sp. NPDC048111 TaxID=3365500 RepID=UPI00371D67BC
MLARNLTKLPAAADLARYSLEAKSDGYRLITFTGVDGVLLQTRRGADATEAFPDIARAAMGAGELVLDGELVVPHQGRLDFLLLQRRARHTGRGAEAMAAQFPAAVMVFDLLEAAGAVLLNQPYVERRALLEELFDHDVLGPPWSLCPATDDPATASQWLTPEWGRVGIEGLCLKPKTSLYSPGVRGWGKLRSFESAEGIIAGVTGPLTSPGTLLLGRYDTDGRLRLIARSTPLARTAARQLAAVLSAADCGHPWESARFSAGWGSNEALVFRPVEPEVVVEFRADTAIDAGRHRHPVRYLRIRSDLTAKDIESMNPD